MLILTFTFFQIGLALVTVGLVILSVVVALRPSDLASVFARDPTFIQRVEEASLPLAALVFSMNLTVALEVTNNSLII